MEHMESISLPKPVQENLLALRLERDRIQQTINLVLSTAINMAGVDSSAEYQLSMDCSELIQVKDKV